VEAPGSSIGFITGFRGDTLRRVEAASGTFIFTDSGRPGEPKGDTEKVFGARGGGGYLDMGGLTREHEGARGGGAKQCTASRKSSSVDSCRRLR
jgi:hypothetical protein